MDAERGETLKRLFEQASALSADARSAFLEDVCGDDPETRRELASLLAAAEEADPFFDRLGEKVASPPIWVDEPPLKDTLQEEPLVGRTVRRYRIEEKLGSGGMGVVYRAHDTQLDRTVALKFLPPHLVADETADERFAVEARAAAALDHPNVCNIHEIGRDEDERPFIAMAYYDGETLKQKLERGPLPSEEAAAYAAQIAAGLATAHAHGIIHRDIKPGNVIVTTEGVAKVLDFGLAKLADVTLTGTGMTIGTVAYMSPEHTRGEELDARTDFWSLGVVLYEMLAGQRPFRGDRQGAVIHSIRNDEPKPLGELIADLPPELERIVSKLLDKDPHERYQSADAFLGDLLPLAPEGLHVERAISARGTWAAARSSFWSQLKQRKVYQTAVIYAVAAWMLVQVAETTLPYLGFPEGAITLVIVLTIIGFPVALGLAWAFEITKEGIHRTRPIGVAPIRPRPLRSVPVRVARGVAGVLAIAAIGAGAVVGVLGIIPGLPREAGARLDHNLVAVAVLENQTGDAALDPLGRQAAERIAQGVHQQGIADVVSTEVALAEAETGEGLRSPEAAASLARASGAGVVIHGAYYVAGDSLQFQLQITDVAEGKVVSALKPIIAARGSGEALRLVQERALGALAAALDLRAGDLYMPTQPPSIEAYRLYKQGEDAWDRGELEDALGYFEQAQASDSTWMAPLLWTLLTIMDARPAEADSLLDVIAGHLEHMSEPEVLRYQILRSHIYDDDPTVRLRAVRRLATLAPVWGIRSGYWVNWQAYRPREALEFLARVDTTGPRFERYEAEYWDVTSRALHMLGDHEEELEAISKGRRRFPEHAVLLDRHLVALGALGRSAEIRAVLDTVLSLPSTWMYASYFPPHWRAMNAAKALYSHGYPDAARQAFEQGLEWLESQPRQGIWTTDPLYRWVMADLLYGLDRWQEAGEIYERLVEEAGDQPWVPVNVLPSLACVAARLGDVERARAISAELEQKIQEVQRSGFDIEGKIASGILRGRARIAAVLGEREEAIRLLREGFRVARSKGDFVREAHRTRDFESLHDYLPYQQFLKPRG